MNPKAVEVMGRYSNRADQRELVGAILDFVPATPGGLKSAPPSRCTVTFDLIWLTVLWPGTKVAGPFANLQTSSASVVKRSRSS